MSKPDSELPLHILHVIFSFETGGAETMLVDIINGQLALGHKVTLIVINDRIDPKLLATVSQHADVIRMNRKEGSGQIALLFRLNRTIHLLHPDVIHVHNMKLGALVRVKRDRIVQTIHDMGVPMKYSRGIHLAAITEAVRNDILAKMPAANVTTILNGIRTSAIAQREDKPAGDEFSLVQVGRLDARKKGQDILLHAIAMLAEDGIIHVRVTFIGDGEDRDKLETLAHELGISDRVTFLGLRNREYIYSHLKDYDAMCHPSRWEGFGLTIAEAMAAGLPLLLTEGDGPWEVADHGRLCLSFPAGDARGCADQIARMIHDYPSALKTASTAKAYVKKYDISETVRKYITLYRAVINNDN